MQIVASDEWCAERQAVANTVNYVAQRMKVVPNDVDGMIAAMLELRPTWSKHLSRGEKISRQTQRQQWRSAWAGCRVLNRGVWKVADVLG